MATADEALAAPPASPLQQMAQNFSKLSQRQKLAGAGALAFAIALLVGVWLWSSKPDYQVLFSNLEERDGGAIVTALQQQNVPYTFSEGGGAILVPGNMVHEVRLRLAAEGLPRGGLVGFELMENQKLGLSQFNEQVNFQRALEGELSRTVQAIATVSSARVHLAIPKQTAFLRDEQKPTASVFVNLYPGRVLEPAQVAGVVHLVASSVPQLSPDLVSIVDQSGKLLTQKSDPLRAAGLDPTQLKYVDELEKSYSERINTILLPLVGEGNFRAQVTADVDFDQTEQTAETYKPNPSPEQAIRSQQTAETQSRDAGAQGVPGALTNQPPVPATAPITNPAVAGAAGANGQLPLNSTRNATTNYELDKTVAHVRRALGQVKRLSVAVVVNHRTSTQANGRTETTPLTDQEIERITNLVKEAVGYSEARGDTLNVASSPFAEVVKTDEPALPLWKDPENLALAKEGIKYLLLLAVVAFVAFGVIRPLMKTVTKSAEEEQAEAVEGAGEEGGEEGEEGEGAQVTLTPEAAAAQQFEEKLARARELARDDPRVIANLIKEWMGSNEQR
ncbi:MAG: flagellar basal-body MS-ring/collar protein FliF [Rhodocyclaceae bacterium]|nr:flagellar M-ring protein FliF [Rhodocyclaceae bacterium]MCP5231750.1 flagellar M-ring protein FliF [Zoogloeaceae bacterium]MCP5240972.1 flagellar M-ring protein FliF [Zoogloeaceae bacterium]MCP5255597.1 flagellar M-ring protein FliF [Zoogloeaceae bacterium]MCP5294710.1 flagellar M-ring protein FliF [Zoogloeaceae bacterium]